MNSPEIAPDVGQLILTLRGQRVILDADLAKLYGVATFRFNEAVKRNRPRFPDDFLFQLTREEAEGLTSQSAMSKPGSGGHRTLPWAFTEHGALQASNVLNSPRAVAMSVYVIRAFIRLREVLAENQVMATSMKWWCAMSSMRCGKWRRSPRPGRLIQP
jgi:hypothetical protein